VGHDGEHGGPHHDADHEAGEDHAEGGGAGVQDRSPKKHEDVHARLQERLDRAQEQDLLVIEDDPQALHAGATEITLPVSIILLPSPDHQHTAHYEGEESNHERSDRTKPESFSRNIGDDSCQDGDHPVPEGGDGEGDPDPLRGEAVPLRVFVDIPGLECGEEHRGGDPTKDSTNKQPPEVWRHLGQAAEGIDDRKGYCHFSPAPNISQRPSTGTK